MHKRQSGETITLNVQNRPIKEVLTLIERQSDYIFVYYDNILDIHRKVTLKVTNQPISAVLKQLFAGTDNTWKLSGRQIVIGRSVAAAAATPRKITRITGVVRDQNNDPLIGVTIRIKARPNIGTATDINGKYLLDVYPDEVLEFSYVGYKSQDVSVAGQEIVDVVMLQTTPSSTPWRWWATACRKDQRHRLAADHSDQGTESSRRQPHTRPCGPRIGSGLGTANQ